MDKLMSKIAFITGCIITVLQSAEAAVECAQYAITNDFVSFQVNGEGPCFVVENQSRVKADKSYIFEDAQSACFSKGGRLAWIPTDALHVDIKQQLSALGVNGENRILTGLKQDPTSTGFRDKWYWMQDSSLGPNEPAAVGVWDRPGSDANSNSARFGPTKSNINGFADTDYYNGYMCEYHPVEDTTVDPECMIINDCNIYHIGNDAVSELIDGRCFVVEDASTGSTSNNYNAAQSNCESRGGRLAWIETDQLFQRVIAFLVAKGVSSNNRILNGLKQDSSSTSTQDKWFWNQPTQFGSNKPAVNVWTFGSSDFNGANDRFGPIRSDGRFADTSSYYGHMCEYGFNLQSIPCSTLRPRTTPASLLQTTEKRTETTPIPSSTLLITTPKMIFVTTIESIRSTDAHLSTIPKIYTLTKLTTQVESSRSENMSSPMLKTTTRDGITTKIPTSNPTIVTIIPSTYFIGISLTSVNPLEPQLSSLVPPVSIKASTNIPPELLTTLFTDRFMSTEYRISTRAYTATTVDVDLDKVLATTKLEITTPPIESEWASTTKTSYSPFNSLRTSSKRFSNNEKSTSIDIETPTIIQNSIINTMEKTSLVITTEIGTTILSKTTKIELSSSLTTTTTLVSTTPKHSSSLKKLTIITSIPTTTPIKLVSISFLHSTLLKIVTTIESISTTHFSTHVSASVSSSISPTTPTFRSKSTSSVSISITSTAKLVNPPIEHSNSIRETSTSTTSDTKIRTTFASTPTSNSKTTAVKTTTNIVSMSDLETSSTAKLVNPPIEHSNSIRETSTSTTSDTKIRTTFASTPTSTSKTTAVKTTTNIVSMSDLEISSLDQISTVIPITTVLTSMIATVTSISETTSTVMASQTIIITSTEKKFSSIRGSKSSTTLSSVTDKISTKSSLVVTSSTLSSAHTVITTTSFPITLISTRISTNTHEKVITTTITASKSAIDLLKSSSISSTSTSFSYFIFSSSEQSSRVSIYVSTSSKTGSEKLASSDRLTSEGFTNSTSTSFSTLKKLSPSVVSSTMTRTSMSKIKSIKLTLTSSDSTAISTSQSSSLPRSFFGSSTMTFLGDFTSNQEDLTSMLQQTYVEVTSTNTKTTTTTTIIKTITTRIITTAITNISSVFPLVAQDEPVNNGAETNKPATLTQTLKPNSEFYFETKLTYTMLNTVAEEAKPLFPLSKNEKLFVDVIQTFGCVYMLWIVGMTFIVFFILRDTSIERVIHMNHEIALFLAHVLIVTMRHETQLPTLCKWASFGLQWFFLATFLFMALEGLHTYSIMSNVVSKGGYWSRKQFTVFGWLISLSITIVNFTIYRNHYVSTFSCWLNAGHRLALGTGVPVLLFVAVGIIASEASSMDDGDTLPLANRNQRKAAIGNQIGVMITLPASLFSWGVGMWAVFKVDVTLYTLVFISNVTLGTCIFLFHALGNPKAHDYLSKLWSKLKRC